MTHQRLVTVDPDDYDFNNASFAAKAMHRLAVKHGQEKEYIPVINNTATIKPTAKQLFSKVAAKHGVVTNLDTTPAAAVYNPHLTANIMNRVAKRNGQIK